MIAGRPSEILRQLEEHTTPDRELLSRFIRESDQSAFAEIVRAHGPIVLGVCRRVTGHPQDAEDAFQVVFLSLARKATTIRNPEVLGGWLYGVAVRVARKVRRSAGSRRAREVAVGVLPEVPTEADTTNSELKAIIDEELAALPMWYRDAIVLCDLRSLSRQEAAITLGVPEGTLSSRLAKGRKKLAERLTRRGIALSVAAVSSTLSNVEAALVPAKLLVKTCSVVADYLTGVPLPRSIARLIEGGMTMRKILLLVVLGSAMVAASVVFATQPAQNPPPAEQPRQPVPIAKQEAAEQPALEPRPEERKVTYTTAPRLRKTLDIDINGDLIVLWNAQGTTIAAKGMGPGFPAQKGESPIVQIMSFTSMDKVYGDTRILLNKDRFIGFTPDGQGILTELREYDLVSGIHRLDVWGMEKDSSDQTPATKRGADRVKPQYEIARSTPLNSTETTHYAFAADGKTFRTLAIEHDRSAKWKLGKIHVQQVDAVTGKLVKSLLKLDSGPFLAQAFSADGNRLAVLAEDDVVTVYDVDRGTKLSSYALTGSIPEDRRYLTRTPSLAFSPDGHRLIVCRGIGGLSQNFSPKGNSRDFISGGIGQTAVINADTGRPFPPLEDADECVDTVAGANSFTADGRLLALSGQRYEIITRVEKDKVVDHIRVKFDPLNFLAVWDTQTGKRLRLWEQRVPACAFNPTRPLLAVFEPNSSDTRLGLWDFTAEAADGK